jgi:hypothetical protein
MYWILMPVFVICAGVNESLTQANIATELWNILATGSDSDVHQVKMLLKIPAEIWSHLNRRVTAVQKRWDQLLILCQPNSLYLGYIRIV